MYRLFVSHVQVVDWAEWGDAYVAQTEDGPVVRSPAHEAVVVAHTRHGRRFIYRTDRFQRDFVRANRFAERVMRRGWINIDLDVWNEGRPVYGSEAYREAEQHELELERQAH